MSTMEEPAATTSGPMEMPASSADLTGVSLYRLSCSACHGQDRAGNTFEDEGQSISVPALAWDDLNSMYVTQPSRGNVSDQLTLAITKGQDETGEDMDPMMPRWSSLSQAQVDSLIGYLQTPETTSAVDSDLSPAAMNLKGEQLYLTACAACHGVDGAGKTFERQGSTISTPSLHWAELSDMYSENPGRGNMSDQLTLAITKGQDESGDEMNPMMPRWSFLSQAQVDSLIQYLQTAFK
ncbi:MAG: c-type cytochrome [Chloroflexi bacterium]|nr:c-type cytochrome [Chloroflexota bacterium]